MFIPDWRWTQKEDIPNEGWTLLIREKEILFKASADTQEALEAGSPLIPLDRLPLPADSFRLGIYRERPLFIRTIEEIPEGMVQVPMRPALGLFEPEMLKAVMLGNHLLNWENTSQFCGRCGGKNSFHHHEKARHCPDCGMLTFPRLSPAVITAVTKGRKLLLAHNRNFPAPVYSLIAGFVDAGETLEETVRREIREEVGIEVKNIRYFASQPWPFPDSLMLGFTAEWESGEIEPDGIEIEDAGWFTPEEHPQLPGLGSIARRIIGQLFSEWDV